MATLILTAVGSAVGGPIGGAIGSLIGQQIDQRLFAPKAREGARLGDLAVQGSTYGAFIPKVFGTMRVAGTVIWAMDLQEDRRTVSQGKGRPKATVYSYRASFAVALSARLGMRVGRIWADGKLLRGAAGDFKVATGFRFHSGREDASVDPLIAAVEGAGQAPAYRGLCYCVFEDLAVESFGNRIPLLTFEVIADEGLVGLGLILNDLAPGALQADGPAALIGYVAQGGTLRDVIEPLTQIGGLTAWDDGIVLRLFSTPSASHPVPARDLGSRAGMTGGPKWTRQRAARSALLSVMRLGYADPARDFQPGEQRADLFEPGQAVARDLPAALDAATARQWALAALLAARSRADDLTLSLPWRHLALLSGTGVTLEDAALSGDWRVAGFSLEAMRIDLHLNRAPLSTSPSAPADAGRGVPAPDTLHGPTRLVVAELPWLDPGVATQPLVIAAAAGTAPGWRQASLMQSDSSGARWTAIGTTAAPALIGTLVAPLAPGPATQIDRRNSLTLAVLHDEMALTGCSMDALLAGRNLIHVGGELIQFLDAQRIGPALYRLSGLLRGRRGTEDRIGGHAVGAEIVVIDRDTMVVLEVPNGANGLRILANGVADTTPVEAAVAVTARAVRPLSPVHLKAQKDRDGSVRLSWIRRSREGWAWPDAVDAPLSEEQERYGVTLRPDQGAIETREETAAQAILTAARLAAFQATGARQLICEVAQLGKGGASPPARIEIALI